jgi:hypothetical protein
MEVRACGRANHLWCDQDCPCTCEAPDPYQALAGTVCKNCFAITERKATHRFITESVLGEDTWGEITIMTSVFDPIEETP